MRSLILLVPISTHALRAASCTSKNKPYHRQVVVAVQGAAGSLCILMWTLADIVAPEARTAVRARVPRRSASGLVSHKFPKFWVCSM